MTATRTRADALDPSAEGDVETHRFEHAGRAYVIDLAPANAQGLQGALRAVATAQQRIARYLAAARVERAPRKPSPTRSRAQQERSTAMRRWAREQGYTVSDTGRLADNIVREYDAQHPAPKKSGGKRLARALAA